MRNPIHRSFRSSLALLVVSSVFCTTSASKVSAQDHKMAVDTLMALDVANSPDGSLLAVGTNYGVVLFDVETDTEVKKLTTKSMVRAIEFLPDSGSILLVRDGKGRYETSGIAEVWSFGDETKEPGVQSVVDFDESNMRKLVRANNKSETNDNANELFALSAQRIDESTYSYTVSRCSPLGSLDECLSLPPEQGKYVGDFCFSEDGSTAMLLVGNSTIQVYDATDWKLTRSIELKNGARSIAYANQTIVATGNLNTGEDVFWKLDLPDESASVDSREFSKSNRKAEITGAFLNESGSHLLTQTTRVVVTGRNTMSLLPVVEAREIASGKVVWEHVAKSPGDRIPIVQSADRKSITYAVDDQVVTLEIETGKLVKQFELTR